jgi:hypothetical protein
MHHHLHMIAVNIMVGKARAVIGMVTIAIITTVTRVTQVTITGTEKIGGTRSSPSVKMVVRGCTKARAWLA